MACKRINPTFGEFLDVMGIIMVIAVVAIIFMTFLQTGTIIHEFVGHHLVAKLLFCDAVSSANVFVGTTSYSCPWTDWSGINIIIGAGSLVAVFLIALAIWLFAGENNIFRGLSITMFAYSLFVSAYPKIPGSDMSFMVLNGFPLILAWLLFFAMVGIASALVILEVADRNVFKGWFDFRRWFGGCSK